MEEDMEEEEGMIKEEEMGEKEEKIKEEMER